MSGVSGRPGLGAPITASLAVCGRKKRPHPKMWPFSDSIKSELLCSRSSRSSRSSSRSSFYFLRSGFLCFLCFFLLGNFLYRSFFFFFHFSSRSSSRSNVSSENNTCESNGNESGNDGGHNFFHLNLLDCVINQLVYS